MRIFNMNISEMTDNNNAGKTMDGTGILGEQLTNRPVIQNAGFSHVNKDEDLGVMVADGNTYIVVGSETLDRPILSNAGDTAVYANATTYLKLLEDGSVEINNGKGIITISASGDIAISNGGTVKKLATEDFVNLVYKLHTHPTAPSGPISVPTTIVCPTELTSTLSAE